MKIVYTYKCENCGEVFSSNRTIDDDLLHCPGCSGQQVTQVIPANMNKWNWGGFWLPFWWGLSFRQYWVLIALIFPPAYLVFMIWFGSFGNSIAWGAGRFIESEDFWRCQQIWAKWGWALFVFRVIFIMTLFLRGALS